MRFDPLDFSQLRTAPHGIVRELEDLDPRYGLLHSRRNTWLLCHYAPDAINMTEAIKGLAHWREKVAHGMRYSEEAHVRMRQYRLAVRGWKSIAAYTIRGDSFGYVVNDVRGALWKSRHTSDNELFAEIDSLEYEKRESARKEIADEHRARDAWKYAFTLSHTTSVSQTPADKPRSGFVRHTVPSNSSNSGTVHAA